MRIRDEGSKGLSEGGQQNLPCPLNIAPTNPQWQDNLAVNDYQRKQTKKAELKSPCLGKSFFVT
jgi:hypothetical protein